MTKIWKYDLYPYFNGFLSRKMIDKIEKKLYYIIMTCGSILIVRWEMLGKKEECKNPEKKENKR